ncbi:MAG: Fe-S cluster assembly protein SufD, partial [Bacteroidota bacterium]
LKDIVQEAFSVQPPDSQKSAAFERFLQSGFPTNKHEEYRFTPVTRSLEKNLTAFQSTATAAPVSAPIIDGALSIVILNGQPQPFELPAGVQHLGGVHSDPVSTDPFALLNAAFRQTVVRLEATAAVEIPIHLHWHTDASAGSTFTAPFVEIVVKKNCSLTVIETFSHGAGYAFSTTSLKATVEEGAKLDHLMLQQATGSWNQMFNGVIRQAANSLVNSFVLTTNGEIIRNNLTLEIDGSHAEGNLLGLYLLNGKTLADNHTVVDHRLPDSNSNELYKGVMQGQSKGVFNGKIFVRPDAQKTNAFQSNRNIILADSASVNTKPQLEIWADDVKCSHGCTNGQLDEEGIFYLMSRGIDKATAQAMMLDAYAGEVTDKIPSASLREFIRVRVQETIASLK